MIVWLVAALLLTSPIERPRELQRCVTSCNWATNVCFYELRAECGRAQTCVDTTEVECKPLVVNLGPWDPVTLY